MKQLSNNLYEVATENDFCYKTLWENHNTDEKFIIRWGDLEQTYYFDREFHFIVEASGGYEETSVCLNQSYEVQSVSSGF